MIGTQTYSSAYIKNLLSTINDPEVPAINIVELGIIRDIEISGDNVTVSITPTYSGCPAMKMIEQEIRRVLNENSIVNVSMKTVYSPAWTTDWLDDAAKNKLKAYGISPPQSTAVSPLLQIDIPTILCPHCNSSDTRVTSEFGSTACKAYYYCRSCNQAFEYFKAF